MADGSAHFANWIKLVDWHCSMTACRWSRVLALCRKLGALPKGGGMLGRPVAGEAVAYAQIREWLEFGRKPPATGICENWKLVAIPEAIAGWPLSAKLDVPEVPRVTSSVRRD